MTSPQIPPHSHRHLRRYVGALPLAVLAMAAAGVAFAVTAARADGPVTNLNHVIIVMQENHSFDNYFGVLALAPNGPYHPQQGKGNNPCPASDHQCVNSLHCALNALGSYTCQNSNLDDDGSLVVSFHDKNYCPAPDLQHNWQGSHHEGNFDDPNNMLLSSPNDGFARVNDATEQKDSSESAAEDDTMGFYDGTDLPYYYALAQTFAIDDSYFCPVVGPTVPNRMYLMAATSFGHLTTNEVLPPAGGYKPITGTIFDLLDAAGVNWVDYFTDLADAGEFRTPVGTHFASIADFFAAAASGTLPPVSLVDPELAGEDNLATDEHPPHDIRSGEFFVAQVINAVRSGPNWKDSIIFLTYDEHGGSYDHVAPLPALQGGALNPDGINPGLCEDLSSPPASEQPGGGANCNSNPIGTSSLQDAETLCPELVTTFPAYPSTCANFNQNGFRVPFVAISPFSKPHYVSHTQGDHTSILKLIEERFLAGKSLTLRDANANDLSDMFDFQNAPSMNANVSPTLAPPPNLVTDGNGSCAP